jgi:hypothetical protein
MDAYIFCRSDQDYLEDASPVSIATNVFFQMWRTRAAPYNRLAEGDVMYIGDPATRRLLWETRVTSLLSDYHYASTRQALSALRSSYGLYTADLNSYHRSRAGHGWLLAWAPRVMRRLDLQLPTGFRFGQNGYRPILPAEANLLGLPEPKASRPLAGPPAWYDPDAARRPELRVVPRYIPVHIRNEVAERDGFMCVGCHARTNLHFDHILPYSHGGRATVENLRLLCARSNLARGAGDPSRPLICASA